MPAKRQRRKAGSYINVRLSPERDPDLIEWWQSLPPGTGGDLIKRAIREYIASTSDSTAPTRAELDQAAQWIDQQAAGRFDALAAQIASLSAALASGVVMTTSDGHKAANGTSASDVPQLTAEEIAAREARVKARKW
ncbi:MAG: hypothetical protein ACYDBJ_25595 [Aggregatilineales bacterium]